MQVIGSLLAKHNRFIYQPRQNSHPYFGYGALFFRAPFANVKDLKTGMGFY